MLSVSVNQYIKPIPAFDRFMHKSLRPVTAELKQRHSYEAFMDRTSKHFVFDESSQQLRARPQTSPVKVVGSFQRMMRDFENEVAADLGQQSFASTSKGFSLSALKFYDLTN
jgi:hypothetical protein